MANCNNNASLDSLKDKLKNVDFPEIDLTDVNAAIAEVDNKIAEAGAALNNALSDAASFLNESLTAVSNTSLTDELNSIAGSVNPTEIANKINQVVTEFGEAVPDIASKIDAALASGSIPNFCEFVPNVEKKPDGTFVQKPAAPVDPVIKPAAAVAKPPAVKENLIDAKSLNASFFKSVIGQTSNTFDTALEKVSATVHTDEGKAFIKAKLRIVKQYFAVKYAEVAGYENVGESPFASFISYTDTEYSSTLKRLNESYKWRDEDGFYNVAVAKYDRLRNEKIQQQFNAAYTFSFEEAILNHKELLGNVT